MAKGWKTQVPVVDFVKEDVEQSWSFVLRSYLASFGL